MLELSLDAVVIFASSVMRVPEINVLLRAAKAGITVSHYQISMRKCHLIKRPTISVVKEGRSDDREGELATGEIWFVADEACSLKDPPGAVEKEVSFANRKPSRLNFSSGIPPEGP